MQFVVAVINIKGKISVGESLWSCKKVFSIVLYVL